MYFYQSIYFLSGLLYENANSPHVTKDLDNVYENPACNTSCEGPTRVYHFSCTTDTRTMLYKIVNDILILNCM